MKCPICNKKNTVDFNKKGHDYYFCTYCLSCYCAPIDQSNMVGGGFEIERNTQQNETRIARIKDLVGSETISHLDWGCGHGMLVKDCIVSGINSDGYDKFNTEYNTEKHKLDNYDIITLVEVIEHMAEPFTDLSVMYFCLKPGGVVMVETSFTNMFFKQTDKGWYAELENEYYVEPAVGHNTIFSHFSLDVLMIKKGFAVGNHINDNVRIYIKS